MPGMYTSPPPYNAVDTYSSTVQELRQSFATLIDDQSRITELFRTVAAHLETSSQIGENHALSKEWNELRQVSSCILYQFLSSALNVSSGHIIHPCRDIDRYSGTHSATPVNVPTFLAVRSVSVEDVLKKISVMIADCDNVLIPLALSEMNAREKQFMINKFLEVSNLPHSML